MNTIDPMNTQHILLINPGWGALISRKGRRFNRAWPPLSILICAALLEREGFQVRIIDGRVEPDWGKKLERLLPESDWVGLTSSPLDRWQCPNLEVDYFVDLAASIPSEKLILMGVHGSLFPKVLLNRTGARVVILGEPEQTLLALLTQKDWRNIHGIVFREENEVYHTGPPLPTDIGDLPIPAFHLINPSHYFYELMGRPFALFETSRGCPYECTFCLKAMYGSGVRFKPISHLIEELDRAVTSSGFRYGYFIDLEFTIDRERSMEICDQLVDRNYPFGWCCQTRADSVDAALLKRMKEAGCKLIHFGVESGSARILKDVKKKTDRDTMKRGIRLTQKAGIDTACFFLFGFPGESPAETEETLRFALDLNSTYASFHVITPYPGTSIGSPVPPSTESAHGDMNFPAYCEEHDPFFLNKMVRKAYVSYYFRAPYLLSRLNIRNITLLFHQLRLFTGFIQ
jgi:anaerobic magnesium-protoporphyrin IX monomethyl ester cyclase